MAPKQDKTKAAAKNKTVEDKTFGLKNKNKSKKVEQYIKQVVASQASGNANKQARIAAQAGVVNPKDKKKAEEERQKELNALFAVAIKQPKVPPGADPKSIVCEYFRHGQCTKGFKCKFSHDLTVERKGAKIDLFTDQRDVDKEEGMDDWDQETLERVVAEKHGKEVPTNATSIICKFFLEAVEGKKYGWFWKCPNGGECKYRHALPPGYVLKSQMKELLEVEAANKRDVAEEIEEARAKVDARTPITESVFKQWRQKKVEARRAKRAEAEEERRRKGIMTGREIFMQEGFTVEDDAGASGADDLIREGFDDEEREIQEMLAKAREAAERAKAEAGAAPQGGAEASGDGDDDEGQQGQAGPSTHLQLEDEEAAELFDGDDDDEEELDDDDDDGDLDDDELDALEEGIRGAQLDDNGAGPSNRA